MIILKNSQNHYKWLFVPICLLLSGINQSSLAASGNFSDVSGYFALAPFPGERLTSEQTVPPVVEPKFQGERHITKAELAKALIHIDAYIKTEYGVSIAEKVMKGEIITPWPTSIPFSKQNNQPLLFQSKELTGPVTRYELAACYAKLFQVLSLNPQVEKTMTPNIFEYSDLRQEHWAWGVKFIQVLIEKGIMVGYPALTIKDVPSNHWAYWDVQHMFEQHIMPTSADGHFYGDLPVSHIDFAFTMGQFLRRLEQLKNS